MGSLADERRLAVLHRIEALGMGPDADFDRITTLAAAIMQTPVALVSLIDPDRQYFKSCTGISIAESATATSFCAHAIASDDAITVISDATDDPRFAENPLVTGDPHIGFYAGVPVRVAGEKIGTLFVIDTKPRMRPDDAMLSQLIALGDVASSLFELKYTTRQGDLTKAALAKEEKRHAIALEAASIASWVWDIRSDTIECDALLPSLFGLPDASRLASRDIYFAIDRRDIDQAKARFSEALAASDDYSGQYRIRDTNPPRWLAVRGKVVERNPDGTAALVYGVNFDITETKASEERQRLLLRELNHRVKNTLATVQALATQTVRHARKPQEFLTAFTGRLQALGAAHGVLSDYEWRGIGLRDLIRLEVSPFDVAVPPRLVVTGDNILLSPDQALALGLILHELGSNALAYGALSVPGGKVDLGWRIAHEEAKPRLEIGWIESGGPTVTPPDHHGFGSILIKRSLAKVLSSKVTHEFRQEGVFAAISMPLEDQSF